MPFFGIKMFVKISPLGVFGDHFPPEALSRQVLFFLINAPLTWKHIENLPCYFPTDPLPAKLPEYKEFSNCMRDRGV